MSIPRPRPVLRRRLPRAGAVAPAGALVLAGVLVLAGALAGCGDASPPAGVAPPASSAAAPPSDPTAAVRRAAVATRDAHTAHVALHTTAAAGGAPLEVTGSGGVSFDDGSADLGVDVPSLGGQLRVLLVGDTAYLGLPPQLAALAGGKTWASADLTRLAHPPGGGDAADAGDLAGLGANPAGQLGALASLRDVRTVGPDTVAGAPATHHTGVVDLDRAAAEARTPGDRATLQRLRRAVGAGALPVDVWTDGQGRLVQVHEALGGPAGGGGAGTVEVTATFSDFGTPVAVTPPPPDQVRDARGLLGK